MQEKKKLVSNKKTNKQTTAKRSRMMIKTEWEPDFLLFHRWRTGRWWLPGRKKTQQNSGLSSSRSTLGTQTFARARRWCVGAAATTRGHVSAWQPRYPWCHLAQLQCASRQHSKKVATNPNLSIRLLLSFTSQWRFRLRASTSALPERSCPTTTSCGHTVSTSRSTLPPCILC